MSKKAVQWAQFTADAAGLTLSERAVLMVLAHHHGRKRGCVITIDTVATLSGLSERCVHYKLRALEDARIITRHRRIVDGRQGPSRINLFAPIERRAG